MSKRGMPPKKPTVDKDGFPVGPSKVAPASEAKPSAPSRKKVRKETAPKPKEEEKKPRAAKPKRKPYTFTLPEEMIERLRDAAYETRLSMAQIVEAGLLKEFASIERKLGYEIPERPADGEIRTGRPPKARGA